MITTDNPIPRGLLFVFTFLGHNLISQVATVVRQYANPGVLLALQHPMHTLLIVSHHLRCCSLLVPV